MYYKGEMQMLHSIGLKNLIGEDLLHRVLSSFKKATDLRAVIVDDKGEGRIVPAEFPEDCQFCSIVRSSEKGLNKCIKSYAQAGQEAAKYGEPYIFRCHAGLVGWAAPLMLEDQYLGAIICAQVLMWEPEAYFLEEIKDMCSDLEIDLNELISAAQELPVISPHKVQGAADLLFVVANHFMKSSLLNLQQRKEISEQQARLGEEMQARKQLEEAFKKVETRSSKIYALEKEQELVTKVRNGDWDGTYRALNELLADILQKYPGNIQEIKTRALELLVVMSRAAVEGGANLKKLLTLNSRYINEMMRLENIEDLCLWLLKITQKFVDCVDEGDDIKNLQVIQKAAEYMKNNFTEKLTIDDISQAVYLSPCYLSKIFKQELGCTIMEFLTKVRIEEAKKLLKNPRYNIMQVANEIGFEDPSYFTKVFKRSEGVTPSQYKRKAL
jgi:two-component system response regulator YesN